MHETIQPPGWAPARGYANGIATRDGLVFTGGQIGWNAEQQFETRDFVSQLEQALRNVVEIVETAGGSAADIVRLTWYIVDRQEYAGRLKEVGEAYRRVMGRHYPAMAVVIVAGLVEEAARVEIEATAVLQASRG